MLLIKNGNLLAHRQIREGAIVIHDKTIAFAGPLTELPQTIRGISVNDLAVIDANGAFIAPGLIDLHIHGCYGVDFMEEGSQALTVMSEYLASQGVTAFLPSTLTASPTKTRTVVEQLASFTSPKAKAIGLHLEGPYINYKRKGAQYGPEIRQADIAELSRIYDLLGEGLRLVTLAPEEPQALEAVDWLRQRGVTVSIGHSDASYEQAMAGFNRGITNVTHTFNGMSGLHHREPGVVGASLAAKHVYNELIADGIHVHPGAMQVLYNAKGPERIILISDALQATGLPDGEYVLGDQKVTLKDGAARLAEGNLAGSTLSMIKAIRNMVEILGIPLLEAVKMATANPAQAINLGNKGELLPGMDADVVVFSSDFTVQTTIVEGKVVYQLGNEVD